MYMYEELRKEGRYGFIVLYLILGVKGIGYYWLVFLFF